MSNCFNFSLSVVFLRYQNAKVGVMISLAFLFKQPVEVTPFKPNLFCYKTILSSGNNGVVTLRWNSASLLIKNSAYSASMFADNNYFPPVEIVP